MAESPVYAALNRAITSRGAPGPLGVQNRNQFLSKMPSPADDDAAMDRGIEDDPTQDKRDDAMEKRGMKPAPRRGDHDME